MKRANQFMQADQLPEDQFPVQLHQATQPSPEPLPFNDLLQIKAAEFWLRLGEADLALKELENLPSTSWRCRWALRTRIAAMGVLREGSEGTV